MEASARRAWGAARPAQHLPFETACVAPWVSLELDPSGWAYACCANQAYPLGKVGEQRLGELWGGERAMVLRDALRRWDLSVGCGTCRWHIEHGRMDPDAAVYDRYVLSSAEPAGPVAMTFALSNRCNLGCVMCNPALSSTLRHQAGLAPLPASYDDQFFEDLASFLPGLQYAKFLGGEPFLIPEHHRVWSLMDEVGGPPVIQVTTNGTVWNDRVEWLVSTFVVDVTVSIDAATTTTYEAIRRGAHHQDVLANVARFRAACAASGAQLRFCFCLMANNWSELGAFLEWADELDVPVSINVVSDDGMALHDLAVGELETIADAWASEDRLRRTLDVNADVWRTQRAQLDAVLAERRSGVGPTPRQPMPVPRGFFSERSRGLVETAEEGRVAQHVDNLTRWSIGGPVAAIEIDHAGLITAVRTPHHRLGLIEPALVGQHVDMLVGRMTECDGRPAWMLDVERFADHTVRMIGLSTNPVRGNPASMVRTIELASDAGTVLLVAEDRIFERPNAVVVPAPKSRPPNQGTADIAVATDVS